MQSDVPVEKLFLPKFAKMDPVRMRHKRSRIAGHFSLPNFVCLSRKASFSTFTGDPLVSPRNQFCVYWRVADD